VLTVKVSCHNLCSCPDQRSGADDEVGELLTQSTPPYCAVWCLGQLPFSLPFLTLLLAIPDFSTRFSISVISYTFCYHNHVCLCLCCYTCISLACMNTLVSTTTPFVEFANAVLDTDVETQNQTYILPGPSTHTPNLCGPDHDAKRAVVGYTTLPVRSGICLGPIGTPALANPCHSAYYRHLEPRGPGAQRPERRSVCGSGVRSLRRRQS